MADISIAAIHSRIRAIVASSDHNTLTVKGVRLQLEHEFGVNLLCRKAEIQACVDACLCGDDQGADDSSEQDFKPILDTTDSPRNTANGNGENESANSDTGSRIGPESEDESDDASDVGAHLKRTKTDVKVAKKSKSRRSGDSALVNEADDAEVARRLSVADVYGLRHARAATASAPRRKSASVKREPGEKAATGFHKPVRVSEQLAALLGGEREVSRPEIVKRIWNIVKERDLLDVRNRQYAVCDAELTELFGRARIRMFGMMKLLKRHITPI